MIILMSLIITVFIFAVRSEVIPPLKDVSGSAVDRFNTHVCVYIKLMRIKLQA